jgi:hypothetical protein
MVCTAAPIRATQPLITCDIACDGDGASGRKSARTLHGIRDGVSTPFQNNRPPQPFNQGVSLLDATHAQLEFVDRELACFIQAGTWEPCTYNDYVSRLFLVPKPGNT